MEFEFLKSLEVIFITSAAVILLLYKLKIPSLIGFIISGIIIGPNGVGLINDIHFIRILAEIGVILLLFTIGIEFSMTKLLKIRKAVLGGGGAQVFLTIVISAALTYIAIGNINKSLFCGSGAEFFESAGVGEGQGHEVYGVEDPQFSFQAFSLGKGAACLAEDERRIQEKRHRMPAMAFHKRRG
jgi:hypothetical protein